MMIIDYYYNNIWLMSIITAVINVHVHVYQTFRNGGYLVMYSYYRNLLNLSVSFFRYSLPSYFSYKNCLLLDAHINLSTTQERINKNYSHSFMRS